ncbi:4Fe-4S ferredoxin N-terminal domain-containing protein [Halobacteriales archaeon Cl-PHB]
MLDGTDSSLFADDPAHEERMREILEESDHDTELGLEMARDAQRLVAGDITEREFHEKYHEAVVDEFGEDERGLDFDPEAFAELEDADQETVTERLQGAFEDPHSRREFVKKGGVAAMGMSMLVGGKGDEQPGTDESAPASASGGDGEDDGTRWGMVINLDNCDGCLECVAACKSLHGTSKGAHWMYVMAYEEPNQGHENFFVRTCMHCGDAPCEKVCPVGARHTREKDALVLSDYDICIGCRYCMVSCPYGANYFQWGEPDQTKDNEDFTHDERGKWVDGPPPEGVMGKCTFEPAWQDGQMGENLKGTTMCEQACTRDAIHFGDMNDPESAPNKHLEAYKQQQANDTSEFEDRKPHTVSTFKAMEDRGTDPGVTFIGNEPSEDARQVEGPVTYEEMGLVDNRKEVVDEGAAANGDGENA